MTASAALDVSVVPHRSFVLVAASGEIDLATCGQLRDELDRLWDSGWEDIVVDLREVSFMDTQGLAVVIEAQQEAARDGWRFVLTRAPERVHRLFDMIGLTPRLTIVDDPAAAGT